jgi:hypothetical protein
MIYFLVDIYRLLSNGSPLMYPFQRKASNDVEIDEWHVIDITR